MNPVVPIPAGPPAAPVNLGTANAAMYAPGAPALPAGPVDLGRANADQFANLAPQQAPGIAPGAPGQIAPDPYLPQLESQNEDQARLEAEHGRLATVGTQFARGALDFVMQMGAVPLATALEGAGTATGWDGLRDFGRDYGQSASGAAAMATLFNRSGYEAVKGALGVGEPNSREIAETAYNRTRNDIQEQTQAWPMLSTLSRLAGVAVPAIATGGLAAGAEVAEGAAASSALSNIAGAAGLGAYETAGASAQQAYEDNRPYRDVLGSALMGGLLGGVTGGVLQGGAELLGGGKFTSAVDDFGTNRSFKAYGGIQSDVNRIGGADQIGRLVKDVSGYTLEDGSTVIPQSLLKAGTISQEEIAERIARGAAETGEKLGNMRRTVSEFIDSSAPDLRPKVDELLDQIRPISEKLADDPILKGRAGAINDVVESIEKKAAENGTISVNDLRSVQESLKSRLYTKVSGDVPAAKEELKGVERMLEDTIEKTVDKAVPQMGTAEAGAYRQLRSVTRSFIQAEDISGRAVGRQIGNRWASLTDTGAGLATLGGSLAAGGPLVAGAKALGATVLHKFTREHGAAFMAALAKKVSGGLAEAGGLSVAPEAETAAGAVGGSIFGSMFDGSRDAQHVSVDAAGGREAQQVIASLNRARLEVAQHVENAGPNPVQRQAAQQYAMAQIATNLATKAGVYDPTNWAQKPPNPLQKVLHRGPILDQVSADLAKDTAHAASLKPSPDFALNPDRIKKLTKDADGPLAIGGVQQAAKALGDNAPPTPTGDEIRLLARNVMARLSASDVPDAMTTGHDLARMLSNMGNGASDQLTKDYVARQVTNISQQLSSPAFGKAGALYSKLTAQTDPSVQQLMDPATIRDSLSKADSTGALPDSLKALAAGILDAHDAKKQLGGPSVDREIQKQLKDVQDKYAKAEKAVTLDGGPAGRVLDFFDKKPGAPDTSNLRSAPEMAVLNAVRPQMERLLPVLGKDQSDRYTGAKASDTIPDLPKTSGDLQSLYTERMQTLAQAVNSPDPDSLANTMKGMPNVPPAVQTAVAADSQQRAAQLLADMPKPTQNIRGKAFETLSSDDLRKANAMWEATTKPMSVFSDFHSGTVDYTKSQYAWKQYPGLQQAAQAGMMDAIHAHLNDDERAAIPDTMLTQLDYLLGFNGTLQTSVDRGFASQMTAMAQADDQSKPQQNGPLELASSKPTFTERIAQGRG